MVGQGKGCFLEAWSEGRVKRGEGPREEGGGGTEGGLVSGSFTTQHVTKYYVMPSLTTSTVMQQVVSPYIL